MASLGEHVQDFVVPYEAASTPYIVGRLAVAVSGLSVSIFLPNNQGMTLPIVGMFADWTYRHGMDVRDDVKRMSQLMLESLRTGDDPGQ